MKYRSKKVDGWNKWVIQKRWTLFFWREVSEYGVINCSLHAEVQAYILNDKVD